MPPVLAQAALLSFAEQCFEPAVLLQGVAGLGTVAVEIGAQGVVAIDEVFEQHLQQLVACRTCFGPIDQWPLLEVLKFVFQAQSLDRHAHRALAEQQGRAGVQAVEP
ncbi:hypothetical protein D3C77_428930 [compost metagenome]